jgi:hypothetical protein
MFNTPYHGKPPYPPATYRQEALDELAYLWKLDDPVWVKQRKKDWAFLRDHCGYKDIPRFEKKLYEGYFKYGRQESHNANKPTDNYIPHVTLLTLTPYTSPETAKAIFDSELLRGVRDQAFSGYIYSFNTLEKESIPWYETHTRYFIQGVLGETYHPVMEKHGSKMKDISPEPTVWCKNYIYHSLGALIQNEQYSICYECVNYFLSALPFGTSETIRKRTKLKKLMEQVAQLLEDNTLTGAALTFAQQLKQHEQEIWDKWAEGEQKMLALE